MTPEGLQAELRAAGLEVLAVSAHPLEPNQATVFLHGARGQWVDGYALRIIKQVPGVRRARPSHATPAILVVELDD